MSKKINLSDLKTFDMAEHLKTSEDISNYLTVVIEDGDNALLAAALGDIARARGMTQIAKETGLAREALYRALRPNAQPRFETINRVCHALGVKLVVQPLNA